MDDAYTILFAQPLYVKTFTAILEKNGRLNVKLYCFFKKVQIKFRHLRVYPGFYRVKNFSGVLHNHGKGIIHIEHDNNSMNTKMLFVKQLICFIGPISFDGKSFLITLLGFNLYCDYKPTNEHISQKNNNVGTIDKFQLDFDCIDGSVVIGVNQPILFRFL